MKYSILFPGTSPTPIRAHTSVTFSASPSDNPVTAMASVTRFGFDPHQTVMYVTRGENLLAPRGGNL